MCVCVHTMTLTLTNMLASFEASRNDLCGTQFPVAHAPRYFLLVEGLLVVRWVNDGAGGTWLHVPVLFELKLALSPL